MKKHLATILIIFTAVIAFAQTDYPDQNPNHVYKMQVVSSKTAKKTGNYIMAQLLRANMHISRGDTLYVTGYLRSPDSWQIATWIPKDATLKKDICYTETVLAVSCCPTCEAKKSTTVKKVSQKRYLIRAVVF